MFSKVTELAGFTLIALGISWYLAPAAGIIFGGVALLLVGSTVDDASLGASFRRGTGWIRYAWHRQLARESGIHVPRFRAYGLPEGWVPCDCGGQDECPLCDGSGTVPDPRYRVNPRSPHPPIKVDPESQAFWTRMARARTERGKIARDRSPALRRHDYTANGDDVERLA